MKRFGSFLLLFAALGLVLLLPTLAIAGPAGNTDCFACHANGGQATSQVDFAAASVDVSKCDSCHWLSVHEFDTQHVGAGYADYLTKQCSACHHSSFTFPVRPQVLGWPSVSTTAGWFQSAASLVQSPQTLHAIHVNGSWLKGNGECDSCHGAAACSACHDEPAASHANHGELGPREMPRTYAIGKKYGDASPDTYLYQSSPTGNYDTASTLYAGKTGTGEERFVVSFPLAKVSGATVTTATLQLTRSSGTAFPLRAYRLRRNDWAASQASWNTYKTGSAWGAAGAKSAATDYYADLWAESSSGSFDVTALMRAAIAEGRTTLDLVVVDPAPVLKRYNGFYSANGAYAEWYPWLKVDGTQAVNLYAYGPVAGTEPGSPTTPDYVTPTRTCVSAACHALPKAATAEFVPTCGSCHPERLASHGYDAATHTGSPAPAAISISGVSFGTMACGTCHDLELGAEHNKATSSGSAKGCAQCHRSPRDSFASWDRSTCAQGGCHAAGSSAPLHATIDADHAFPTDKASCLVSGCHDATGITPFAGRSLAQLHAAKLGCATCHATGVTPTADCTTAGCHADKALPHGYTPEAHLAAPAAAPITVNGTAYAPLACSTCHTSLELGPIHLAGTVTCSTCHATVVGALGTWDKSCAQGGCHTSGANAMHAQATSDHLRANPASDGCFVVGCHVGGADYAATHATKQGCATCHGAGKTPTSDCAASGCHNMANPHGDLTASHASSGGWDFISAGLDNYSHSLGDGTQANCSQCHATRLLAVHANNCATCHASTARSNVKTAIANRNTNCVTCHPNHHTVGNPTHEGLYDQGDYGCGPCHGNGCEQCHGIDTTPPTTTTTLRASYIGDASISFNAADTGGIQATYYRLDGGVPKALIGPSLVVPAPSTGSAPHTLEYWSVDSWDNVEPAHTGNAFTVSADTVAPVTTSDARSRYWSNAVINLTPTDDATSLGARTTFYSFDDGPLNVGITATLPFSANTTHTLHFWSVDYAGNVEPANSATFTFEPALDVTAPTTTSSFNPAAGAAVNANPTVTLIPTDDASGSGVKATYYKIDGGSYTVGTSFTVSGDGLHTFSYYSIDFAGVVENAHTSNQFRIDTVAPSTTCDAVNGATYLGTRTFTLTSGDPNGSGVASTWYSIDGGAATSGTAMTVAAPSSGIVSHTISWHSRDVAGNQEAAKSITVQMAPPAANGSVIAATGVAQYFAVPTGVTRLTVDLYGGMGSTTVPSGSSVGGRGGYLKATIDVTPGQLLILKVGKAASGSVGGWGGGSGGNGSGGALAGGGSTSIGSASAVFAEAGGGGGGGMGPGGSGGTYSLSTTGGNRPGGSYTGGLVRVGGGGGWTGGAYGSASAGGAGGTSHVLGNSYLTCTPGGNTTSADGWAVISW